MAKRLPAGVEADGESSGPGSVGAGSARVGLAGLLRDLTPRPGVYRMLDTSGVLLYVGKDGDDKGCGQRENQQQRHKQRFVKGQYRKQQGACRQQQQGHHRKAQADGDEYGL